MSVLNHIKDYRVVKVAVPLKNEQRQSLDGVAKITTTPQFEVTFLPDQLKGDELNREEFCLITFDVAGENKSIKAKINEVVDDTKLLLEMVDSFSHVQKREYFRVDADLSVSYWVIDDDNPSAKSVQPLSISVEVESAFRYRNRLLRGPGWDLRLSSTHRNPR